MSKLILVVEDDDGIRDSLKDLLEFEGYQVQTARHGQEACEQLLSGTSLPALILLDLMMPVMDGWEFLKIQSGDPSLSKIPVVIVSAAGDHAKVPQAQAYLRKPIHLDKFMEVVKSFCDGPK